MKLASAPAARAAVHAGDGLVHPQAGQRVGAGHDEEVASGQRVHGGSNLLHVIFAFDDAFPAHVAAFFRPHLIFEKAASGPRGDQFLNRAVDVQRVAVTGVGIHDHRYVDAHADPASTLDHLGLRQQSEIRFADQGGGDGVTRHEGHRETGGAERFSPRECHRYRRRPAIRHPPECDAHVCAEGTCS